MVPPIFQLLKASPAVTAILGANPKVYAHGEAPQGTKAPYVAWFCIDVAPEHTLDAVPDMDRVPVQLDCYHADDAGAEGLARAVRDAIEPNACMTGRPIDGRDPATKFYRIALQFDFLLAR